jgi:hypothetical protein
MALKKQRCYCFVSEADSIAGPRVIQALTETGEESHLFFPPYRAPLDNIPRELCRHLAYSLGYRDFWIVTNGQGVIDQGVSYAPAEDETAERCRELGRKRISLWIEGYPRARKALSHPGNTYPRWGYRVMDFLLREGADWSIFRPENLGDFIYYLEWCIRCSPAQYGRYLRYVSSPPKWYIDLFPTPPPRPHHPQDQRWNPYHPLPPKTLPPEMMDRLKPLG